MVDSRSSQVCSRGLARSTTFHRATDREGKKALLLLLCFLRFLLALSLSRFSLPSISLSLSLILVRFHALIVVSCLITRKERKKTCKQLVSINDFLFLVAKMSLVGLMGSIAGFVRVRFLHDRANIDNPIFRLHYRFTSAFFFAACLLITAFDLIGSPIDCITDDAISRPEVINTYCWIQHTFTLPGSNARSGPNGDRGLAQAYPGVRPEEFQTNGQSLGERRIHSYYQWVPFVLFFQGILFYLPHWLWKQWEEGKVRNMTEGSRGFNLVGQACSLEERRGRSGPISDYLQETLDTNGRRAWAYALCELLNLINAIGNVFFIDRFLGGAFLNYGLRVIQYSDWDQEDRNDVMIEVFPRMTKCTFLRYGSSGTIQKHDALCVLAWNIFNEKIYIFLWFWLLILAFLSALAVAYRIMLTASPTLRLLVIQRVGGSPARGPSETVIRRIPYGDYFLLHMLGKNLDGFLFNDVVGDLALRFTDGPESALTSGVGGVGGTGSSGKTSSASSGATETAPILTKYGVGVDR